MNFVRYQHIERLGTPNVETEGLLEGTVYVFPKIDGSCHEIWYDNDEGKVLCASRNNVLTAEQDGTGFYAFIEAHPGIKEMAERNKNYRFFGEYLIPHTLRNYTDDAWKKWYIFDVYDATAGRYLLPTEQKNIIGTLPDGAEMIPAIKTLENPTLEDITQAMGEDTYLLQEGTEGEGVVVKNYGYRNVHGRQIWGKIVREEFKRNSKAINKGQPEESESHKAVRESISQEFISKEFYKFTADRGVEWNDKLIPDFLKYIWQEWWKDYSFETLSKLKTVDMKEARKAFSGEVMSKLRKIQ